MNLEEEILKEHSSRFRRELEAKPLLMEIRNIFTESTAQEIERIIDREGNIIALDRILRTLPMRTNWVTAFYNALNGREINKPELAELFKPFINTDKRSEEEKEEKDEEAEEKDEEEAEEKDEEEAGGEKEKKTIYSLDTSLNDVPYFQVLKDFYPDVPPNWANFLLKNGLQSNATLGDVLDNLFINNERAYNQIKNTIKINHAYIRQATLDTDVISLPSTDESATADMVYTSSVLTSESKSPVTSSKEFHSKKLTLSSDALNTVKPCLAPLREVIYHQEKALQKLTQNPMQENETVSIPDRCMNYIPDTADKNSTVSLPDLSRSDYKSKDLKYESLEDELIPKTVDNEETVSKADIIKSEIPERIADKSKVPEANFIEREFPIINQREVPETQDDNNRLMLGVDDIEISLTSLSPSIKQRPVTLNTTRKVAETDVSNDDVLETDSCNSEVSEFCISDSKVPGVLDNKMEVPQADTREGEPPEADVIEQEILKSLNNEMELLKVGEVGESDNNINGANLLPKDDQEKSSMGLQLSILLLAIVVSFSFGYYYRAR